MVIQSLKWGENKIEFTQQKTGKPVTLPLLNDVGDAIIDYLKVRPQTDAKHVFFRLSPPYNRESFLPHRWKRLTELDLQQHTLRLEETN